MGGRFVWRLPPSDRRAIALTFDDGPHPEYTPAVLTLLAQLQVRATFFVVGRNVTQFPDLVRRVVDEGHAVGGHTFDHREIVGLTPAELEQEMETCRRAISDASGTDSKLFRPPRGRMSLASLRRVSALGYRTVHWTRTYSDYQCDGTEALARRMKVTPPRARDVVLLHDHNPHTIAALADAIPRWTAEGLTFQCL
ncbi:MAG TPA: polysaccharide deacetylase family protein [Polyangia bacterium]|nr:polysaccharide deacetylase family protein [Polyangia bacterium]